MSDSEEEHIEEPKIPERVECPECHKRLKPKSGKLVDQYHKKCYEEYTRRIIFLDTLAKRSNKYENLL